MEGAMAHPRGNEFVENAFFIDLQESSEEKPIWCASVETIPSPSCEQEGVQDKAF